MLQRVAECNSRFRYDMQKAEVDYQTRKTRRRLKRSLVDHASPDMAEEQRAARAAANAEAQAKELQRGSKRPCKRAAKSGC